MPTDQELIKIVPSKRQLKYQETDFYAREYVYVGNPELKPEKRRNVIIVF